MKSLKLIAGFLVLYFIYFAIKGFNDIIQTFSFGNIYLTYLLYGFFATLVCVYVIFPLISYIRRPTLTHLRQFIEHNKHEKRLLKYVNKRFDKDIQTSYQLTAYLLSKTDEMEPIIKRYAQQTTVSVMVSPNAFIDGLSILIANGKMVQELSNMLGFRYNIKDLWKMYFNVLTVASVTGLLEEFDDTIEAIIEELAEEFSEMVAEETGKSISGSVPFLNVALSALSPVLQAAGNYAFIHYSGHQFKYALLNVINDEGLSEKEVRRKARKRARQLKYVYIRDMSAQVISGTGNKLKKLNPFTR